MWWAKDHHGYTTNIAEAHVFEEGDSALKGRSTDVPWPKEYIDTLVVGTVDAQKLDRHI